MMEKNSFEKPLKIAIILTALFFVVEIAGGIVSGSLSLLGDAGHMLRDVFALIISLSAIRIAKNLPTKTKTFGYHRIEIFSAFLNGILLLGVSGWIFWEAYQRFLSPRPVEGTTMFFVALIGLAVNLYVAYRLHGSHDVNIRSAFIHVMTDTLSSAAVIFASVWILLTNQTIVDPILGAAIAVFIIYSALRILKESVHILLEFTPKDVDIEDIVSEIMKVKGVEGVHNVHLWTLCCDINVMDAHIYTNEPSMGRIESMKDQIKARLGKFNIKHSTLEFECEECRVNTKIGKMKH